MSYDDFQNHEYSYRRIESFYSDSQNKTTIERYNPHIVP